jgi:hypothetical protein
MAISGDPNKPIGLEALVALGLPTNACSGLEVRFLPNEVVTVVATYHPSEEQVEKLVKVFHKVNGDSL